MSKRDIGAEILEGIREMKAYQRGESTGAKVHVFEPFDADDVRRIRSGMELSQPQFSALLGVSVATLRDWEHGRRTPRGPAQALLRVAERHPEALLA